MQKRTWALLSITLAAAMLFSIASSSLAASTLTSLDITAVNASAFPEVRVSFQALDEKGDPIGELKAEDIRVEEDQKEVAFTLNALDIGARVIFVIDPGAMPSANIITQESRISAMKKVIKEFLKTMDGTDTVMILAVRGEETLVISDFSSSPQDLEEALQKYQPTTGNLTSGLKGVNYALNALKNVEDDGRSEFILFFTSALETNKKGPWDEFNRLISDVSAPIINVVQFRHVQENTADFNLIASSTEGDFYYYDTPYVLDPMFEQIDSRRTQYEVTFRSSNTSTSERHVFISNAADTVHDNAVFTVNVQAPVLLVQKPLPAFLIERSINGMNDNALEPTSTTVRAAVEWPDGYQRNLTRATLLIDGSTVSTLESPSSPFEFTWDIRDIKKSGDNPVTVQVEVQDELGFITRSEPVAGIINVEAARVSLIIQIVSLVLAAAAVVLVIIFRKQIASGAGKAIQKGGDIIQKGLEIVTSITKRRRIMTAKAYIVVTKGLEDGERSVFEIFGTTPIGRSRRHAELIFQGTAGQEESPISRLHCTILDEDGTFFIRDEDSQWGTHLNGNRLEPLMSVELHGDDMLELGQVERGGIELRFTFTKPDGVSTPNLPPRLPGDAPSDDTSIIDDGATHRI